MRCGTLAKSAQFPAELAKLRLLPVQLARICCSDPGLWQTQPNLVFSCHALMVAWPRRRATSRLHACQPLPIPDESSRHHAQRRSRRLPLSKALDAPCLLSGTQIRAPLRAYSCLETIVSHQLALQSSAWDTELLQAICMPRIGQDWQSQPFECSADCLSAGRLLHQDALEAGT